MAELVKTYVAGEMIRVCLTEDGLTACCYVSSEHLVEEKRKQLKEAISRMASLAFLETIRR